MKFDGGILAALGAGSACCGCSAPLFLAAHSVPFCDYRGEEPHSHVHVHEALEHAHRHFPDAHHRHEH